LRVVEASARMSQRYLNFPYRQSLRTIIYDYSLCLVFVHNGLEEQVKSFVRFPPILRLSLLTINSSHLKRNSETGEVGFINVVL
jgi:hypothetical protein